MTTIALDKIPATQVRLCIPATGPWHADIDLADESATPTGRVTLQIGNTACIGTVDDSQSGDYQGKRRIRLIGGAGGWHKFAPAKSYQNDAGVKVTQIASDLATIVGETLEWTSTTRLGSHFIRDAGSASKCLSVVAPGWHVDLDGITRVTARADHKPAESAYDVIDYNPRERIAEIALEDISIVGPGDTISKRLPATMKIIACDYVITPSEFRAFAWMSTGVTTELVDALRRIIGHQTSQKLWGRYRYRVVQMQQDRVELQAVNRAAGLPDIRNVEMWPGVAGVHAKLALSAEVHVEFEAGDRDKPMIVAFVGKGKDGHVPTDLTIDATAIHIGGSGGARAAREGDTVRVQLPPNANFVGTIGGSPASGTLTWTPDYADGQITSGSTKTDIA